MLSPLSLEQAKAFASDYNVIPLVEELFSSSETPLGIFRKISSNGDCFLLESAEQGVWSQYSFIGLNPRGVLTENMGQAVWEGDSPISGELSTDPLEALEQIVGHWKSAPIVNIPLQSGLVGFFGWNVVNLLEKLPTAQVADYQVPMMQFMQFQNVVAMDHRNARLFLISNIFVDSADFANSYDKAVEKLAELKTRLHENATSEYRKLNFQAEVSYRAKTSKAEYLAAVETAKQHVRAGDVFQVVISQRFDLDTDKTAEDIYSVLRSLNPSPYMYLLKQHDQNGEFWIIGSSPEALVKINGRQIVSHPIAGSRPRSDDPAADKQLELDLLADHKERSEHLMLVDLARNDLLRSCEPDSVGVTEFMAVHRYSHVMHLVSNVAGKLRDGISAVRAAAMAFPAGTLSGAPKPRALEIIADLEPSQRGLFGGVVGYFDFAGNADLAIAIRTAFLRNGVARVQAGAGIVLDSVAETEYEETLSKAAVVMRAISIANSEVPNGS